MERTTQIYDFEDITKGDTFLPISFEFNHNLGTEEDPILEPLEIQSFLCQLKPYENGSMALDLTGTIEGNKITLDKIAKFNIPARTYVYDMEITETDGTVFTYLKGTLKVIQDVSNS